MVGQQEFENKLKGWLCWSILVVVCGPARVEPPGAAGRGSGHGVARRGREALGEVTRLRAAPPCRAAGSGVARGARKA